MRGPRAHRCIRRRDSAGRSPNGPGRREHAAERGGRDGAARSQSRHVADLLGRRHARNESNEQRAVRELRSELARPRAIDALFDDGTNGDPTAGDLTFTVQATIPSGTKPSTRLGDCGRLRRRKPLRLDVVLGERGPGRHGRGAERDRHRSSVRRHRTLRRMPT